MLEEIRLDLILHESPMWLFQLADTDKVANSLSTVRIQKDSIDLQDANPNRLKSLVGA